MRSAVPVLRRHQPQRNQANGMTSASQAHHQSTPTIKATLFGASPFRILGNYQKHHPPKYSEETDPPVKGGGKTYHCVIATRI